MQRAEELRVIVTKENFQKQRFEIRNKRALRRDRDLKSQKQCDSYKILVF